MIKHIHVNECDSTQDLHKEQLVQKVGETLLVSCERQLHGRGRGDKSWTCMPGTLCFSFDLPAHREQSFTALEVSLLIAKYFENKDKKLGLKWPNDLWDRNSRKCGGVLIQSHQNTFVAGVGLNLFSTDEELGAVYEAPFEFDKKVWSYQIAHFILTHRYEDTKKLKADWETRCFHINQSVEILEGTQSFQGTFLGLGEYGEAKLLHQGEQKKIFNGTLRVR